MMQISRDNQKRPLTDGKNELFRHMRKPLFSKIDSVALIGSTNSATLPINKDNDKLRNRKISPNNEPEKPGIGAFSLSKNKNIKLAPLHTSLSTVQNNNENDQPLSANYPNKPSSITVKKAYLRKSIFTAHKMAEDRIKKEEIKMEEIKHQELNKNDECTKTKLENNNNSNNNNNIKEDKLNNTINNTINNTSNNGNSNNSNNNNTVKIYKKELSAFAGKKFNSKNEHFISEIKGRIIKWKMGDYIGAGNFGQVFRAMELESGKIIAVKKIPFTNCVNKENLKALENELFILQNLKHKNIVEYLGHEQIENDLYIYLEYVSGGSIRGILSKFGPLPEQTIKVYAKQILIGLDFLHSQKVIHKDIKGANILVDAEGTVKLADFGCAGELEKTLSDIDKIVSETLKGSVPWMAPEVVKETRYGRRSDIWSFGCTILEMATGQIPWGEFNYENHVALLMKIALSDEIPAIPDFLSIELKDFLKACLQRESSNRPYAKDLLKHPFLADI